MGAGGPVSSRIKRRSQRARQEVKLYIEDHGKGSAVVLIHGMPSTTKFFASAVETLSRAHRVLVPELPGYGRTPPIDRGYTFPLVQAMLEDDLLRRGITRPVVVGYSGGAYRALALAFSSRVAVAGVVSLAGLAGLDPEARAGFRAQAGLLRRDGVGDFRASWLARMAAPGFANGHPAEAEDILSWLDCTSARSLAEELDAIASAEDLRPLLAGLKVPVLAIAGALDAAVPCGWSEAIASAVPNGELRVVPGCGHALLYEDPLETTEALRRFVERATS